MPRPRLRLKQLPTGKWIAVAVDARGGELDRSPEGTESEASDYMLNYITYGAWKKS